MSSSHPSPQSLYSTSGEAFIPLWIRHLPPTAMAQHGIVSDFAHHPTSMAKVESAGPFVGETKLDAWLFKHSKFLRRNFKNGMQHTEASAMVFHGGEHEPEVRFRSDTTGSKESEVERPERTVEAEQEQEHVIQEHGLEAEEHEDDGIQVGEEAPGHAVQNVRDVHLQKGTKLRRGSVRRWAFW